MSLKKAIKAQNYEGKQRMTNAAQKQWVWEGIIKGSARIAKELRQKIMNDKGFLERARAVPNSFTRQRLLPFYLVMFMILRLIRVSLQNEVENIFKVLHIPKRPPTGEAFSKARNKIRWQAFEELYEDGVNWRYEFEERITWHGYRVSAIDGTKLALPIDKGGDLLREYGGMGADGKSPTGQASALYDIYNEVIIDAKLMPLATSERELALMHIERLMKLKDYGKELIIFDRGYPSYELMKEMADKGITFLMRVKRNFNLEIDRMETGCDRAMIIPSPDKKKPGRIKVRVLKFVLGSNEEEALITNLADKRMGVAAFKQLYFKRWPIETQYDIVKNKLEIEHFSGVTLNAVKQEFYAAMFMSNYAACLVREAQEEADLQREDKDNKYDYQVNINHAIGTLREDFIEILIEDNPEERAKKLENVLDLVARSVEAVRPGRSNPRKKPRDVKHHHNRKPNR
jgi:hypothetical protein